MLPLYQKYWRTFFDIGLVALTVFLVMYVSSRLYQLATPVFLSILIFMLIEPLARFLHRKGLAKALASSISVILFILIILGVLFGVGLIVISQIAQVQENLPQYTMVIQREFTNLMEFLHNKIDVLPPNITDKMNEYFTLITDFATKLMVNSFAFMIAALSSFSSFMANFGIAVVLAFFLSIEIETWKRIAKEKSPKTFKKAFSFLRTHVFKSIGSYLKAQLIMVLITFFIVYLGLLILNTGNELSLALICAFFDILPLVGVPAILIPWIIYLFIVGNISLAVGLSILLVVVLIVRQLLEPKITGNSIGVSSAFLMLSFMIISLSLFGISGLILSPILIILIKELLMQGYLQSWIRFPREEFEVSPFDMSQSSSSVTLPNEDDNKPIT